MPPTQPLQVATLEWRGDCLDVIDQTLLPERLEVRSLRSVADVVGAIKTLVVPAGRLRFAEMLGDWVAARRQAAATPVVECSR